MLYALCLLAYSLCQLRTKSFVAIGLISYSLYLWHWPVTVYTNMYWESDLNKPFIVAVSLALAYVSYRFVEMRFRKRSSGSVIPGKLKEIGAAALLVSIVSVFILSTEGLSSRIPAAAWQADTTDDLRVARQDCKQFTDNKELDAHICVIGSKNKPPSFVLWGDSHAEAIANALHLAGQAKGISGMLLRSHGCRPILGVYRKGKRRCQLFNNQVVKYIQSQTSLIHVFLAGYWRIPFKGQGYDSSNFLILDDQTVTRSHKENRRVFGRGMKRTLETLKEFNPVIIQDIPEIGSQFGKSVANHFVRRTWLGKKSSKELMFDTEHDLFDLEFDQLLASYQPHPDYVKLNLVLCSNNQCPLLHKGKLVYADGDHLSEYGASLLAPLFLKYFTSRDFVRN